MEFRHIFAIQYCQALTADDPCSADHEGDKLLQYQHCNRFQSSDFPRNTWTQYHAHFFPFLICLEVSSPSAPADCHILLYLDEAHPTEQIKPECSSPTCAPYSRAPRNLDESDFERMGCANNFPIASAELAWLNDEDGNPILAWHHDGYRCP